MIEIEIDGKTLAAQPGETIIQVADKAGIYIPRFCYHKKLSIAASCRMCLVEVEKAPKTLPACATPVSAGMKVNTRSEKALYSQKTVMEFLLVNHPLDCPICDQGGECELQDLSLGYGSGISRFNEGKRAVHDENLGPLIATEMTRCIQCTRCVRFGDEVAGLRELGAMGRGEEVEIATYVEQAVQSELSGNIIDLCPVGALTSKPYRFSARAWELRQHEAIAPHDCLGSNIYIHTRGEEYTPIRQVMRVIPRENEAVNETWISDRDRFSYEAINSPERLLKPLLKRNGQWQELEWDSALTAVIEGLQRVIKKAGPEQIGALISSSATTEECYLLQKLVRGIGSDNIDHRLRQSDFRYPESALLSPALELPLADLETLNSLLLVGSNIRLEQPLASQRLRKAVQRGAAVMCINPVAYDLNFKVALQCIVGTNELVFSLARVLKALYKQVVDETIPAEWSRFLASVEPSAVEVAMAEKLLAGEATAVLLGAYAIQHPDAAVIHGLSLQIARLAQASFGVLSEGANSSGAALAGALPGYSAGQAVSKSGLNAKEILTTPLAAYLLMGVEPELDSAYPAQALQALQQAELVVCLSAFRSEAMEEYAHIMLPISTFAETAGSYVNVEGRWQTMLAATLPPKEVRTGWEILAQLGCLLALPAFDYPSIEAIREELKASIEQKKLPIVTQQYFTPYAVSDSQTLYRIGQWPIYRVDALVRRAKALQATISTEIGAIRIHPNLAQRLNLTEKTPVVALQNNSCLSLPLIIDTAIADNQVWIPAGLAATAGFGETLGKIELLPLA